MKSLLQFIKSEEGSSMAEQALILGSIAVVGYAAINTLGARIKAVVVKATQAIPGGTGMSGGG